ncbi:MAG: preprotein translocase subunit YajC [Beutenbergiaceae bacterium]
MPDGNSLLLIFMLVAVAGLFFMNSRARKRQQQAVAFRDNLQPGQEVMTASGMFGTVVSVEDDRVTLAGANGHQSQWLLQAVAKLVEDESGEDDVDDEVVAEDISDDHLEDVGVDDADEPDLGPDGTATGGDERSR